MRHYGLFWGEFGADLVGVKYCSHTLEQERESAAQRKARKKAQAQAHGEGRRIG